MEILSSNARGNTTELVNALERLVDAYPVPARSIVKDFPSTTRDWKTKAAKAVTAVLSRHEREHLSGSGTVEFDTALDLTAKAIVKAILRERGYPKEKAKSLFDAEKKAEKKRGAPDPLAEMSSSIPPKPQGGKSY